jgi:hypothetical protein
MSAHEGRSLQLAQRIGFQMVKSVTETARTPLPGLLCNVIFLGQPKSRLYSISPALSLETGGSRTDRGLLSRLLCKAAV